jgi:nucleoside-diphosphate-sugar epimerase
MGGVLVTGGSGFLAGWCVIRALQTGHTRRTTVRSLSREREVREVLCFAPAALAVDIRGFAPPEVLCFAPAALAV